MNVTFVYPDFMKGAQGKYYEGIASLASVLLNNGHAVRFFHLRQELTPHEFVKIFISEYKDTELLAFSSTTNAFDYVRRYAQKLRQRYNLLTICGGIHPTLCPQESLEPEGIDIICRGEGEYPLLELCNALQLGRDYTGIRNLWIKKDGQTFCNSLRPLIENLDSLPMPKREIFDYEKSIDFRLRRLVFMASRGCPFECTYCCNKGLREVVGQLHYVRFKSVQRILDEIKDALNKWPRVGEIDFHDDIFTLNKKWFYEFASRYAKEIGLPYLCNSRFDLLDEKTIYILKESGCIGVKVGIESGNDYIRKEVLKRRQERELILNVSERCRKAGLRLYVFNMVGIPFENLKCALDTVKLNAYVRPVELQITIFFPYPGSELYKVCQQNGFLTGKNLAGYSEGKTSLNMKDFPPDEISFAFYNFKYFVRVYELLYRLPKIAQWPYERILDFLWCQPIAFFLFRPFFVFFSLCNDLVRKIQFHLEKKKKTVDFSDIRL